MKKAFSLAALFVASFAMNALADGHYTLKVDSPKAKASAPAEATISVTPADGFHVNKDYPWKLTIEAPKGVTVEKATLTKDEAAKFDEKGAAFKVKFTADSPGKKTFKGQLKLAVCGEKECAPDKKEISFDVDVK